MREHNRAAMRFLAGTPVAVGVTAGLFLGMVGLIAGEFKAQDTVDASGFEINPVVADIETVVDRAPPELVQAVQTPPPPPRISIVQADAPTVRVAELGGDVPDFDPPTIDVGDFVIDQADRDAVPLMRIPPVMPPRAETSGHCRVRFDVSPSGEPFNIVATSCSSSVFKSATVKSVSKWSYQPKIQNGIEVGRVGVENIVRFQLTDERGRIIPE